MERRFWGHNKRFVLSPVARSRKLAKLKENDQSPWAFQHLQASFFFLLHLRSQIFIATSSDDYVFLLFDQLHATRLRSLLLGGPLAVRLGGVVTLVDDKVLGPVVLATAEVGVEDSLGAGGVALLSVERGTGHVRDGGVTSRAAPVLVGGSAERVVLGGGLGEPDVTTVAAKLAGGESVGDVLLDDNGATGGVDEPRACSLRLVKLSFSNA